MKNSGANPATLNNPGEPDEIVYIEPPVKLSDKARPLRSNRFDPVVAAQRQIELTSREFDNWLKDDQKNLARTWEQFTQTPQSEDAFAALNKAVHVIKGNAPILGSDAASMLATPLAMLLERCTNHDRVKSIIYLAINAICRAIEENLPTSDATLREITLQLNKLNSRCFRIKAQAAGKASICSVSCKAKR